MDDIERTADGRDAFSPAHDRARGPVKGERYVPDEITLRAMVETEAIEHGLLPDNRPAFTTADDAIAYLESD